MLLMRYLTGRGSAAKGAAGRGRQAAASAVRSGMSATEFAKGALVAVAIAAASVPPAAAAQAPAPVPVTPAPQQVTVPPEDALHMMVETTLVGLNQANLTNDYSVLVKFGAQELQVPAGAARLAEGFKAFRDAKIDIGALVLYRPVWTYRPAIQNGRLRLVGSYPTRPQQVTFDLSYAVEDGWWRIARISAGLSSAK